MSLQVISDFGHVVQFVKQKIVVGFFAVDVFLMVVAVFGVWRMV
jgi:hypothetical protein